MWILTIGGKNLLRLSWRVLNVSCSFGCKQGGAANEAKIVIVVAASVKTVAFFNACWLRMLCTKFHGSVGGCYI